MFVSNRVLMKIGMVKNDGNLFQNLHFFYVEKEGIQSRKTKSLWAWILGVVIIRHAIALISGTFENASILGSAG